MYSRGSGDEYEREFMCSSERDEAKTFRDDFLKIESRVRVYDPVNAMIVPAPMQSGLQATPCAAAAWSWVGEKMVVWECWSRNLSASEIISETKRIDDYYRPVRMGFSRDAFDAWAHASLKIPVILPLKAHREEFDFVRALQPLFVEKRVSFSQEPREAWPQFTAFPNGPLMAPTALAFALHPEMISGTVMYEDFSTSNIAPDLMMEPGPAMIALNADENKIIGVLCQIGGSGLRVFNDWLLDGNIYTAALRIIQQANVAAQRRCQIIIPQKHFERFKNELPASLQKQGIQTGMGGEIGEGRREIYRMLREQSKGLPRVLISASARWTMNGFLGGYVINSQDGPYKIALEAIESLASLAAIGEFEPNSRTNSVSRDGREFFSARPMVKHA